MILRNFYYQLLSDPTTAIHTLSLSELKEKGK